MAITDLITLALSFFFIIRGSSRGFMNSLVNPFSIIITTILSIVYYQATKNMLISMAIGTIGPFLLTFLLKILLKTWSKATDSDVQPDFFSRLGGAILTLAWGWVFIIFTLIFLGLLPPLGNTLTSIHHDVAQSKSYTSIAKPFEGIFFPVSKQNTDAATNASTTLDAKSLAEDPRFQNILQDPDIQNEINTHDFVKLMSNPKMLKLTQQIMNDPATMKKVMALYKNSQSPSHTEDSSRSELQSNFK